MTLKRLLAAIMVPVLMLFSVQVTYAQDRTVTGKVTDKNGAPVVGATVQVKGTNIATQTGTDGTYSIKVPAGKSVVISSVGYGSVELPANATSADVKLKDATMDLNEVVVTGYGTARKKDLTGAVASVKAKDFNQGVFSSPDALIQGKVAGVQVQNNSGAPGGASTIRIRGISSIRSGNQPLIVVDGVPLSGAGTIPSYGTNLGGTPAQNPLNFINPSDIASMDVLKDASATAIYGSRGANGVIIITTKRGQSGTPRVEFNAQVGFSNLLNKIDVLDGDEYRAALKEYGLTTGDYKSSVDAMDAILQTGLQQNYNVAFSGGNDAGRYRFSAGYLNQEGIVKESGFKKYTANLTANLKFLESKKLGVDLNVLTSHTTTDIAPVSNDAGFQGSLIGAALMWNPTHPLYKQDGSVWIESQMGKTTINPVALLDAYEDRANLTQVLANISPYYKILNNLEYRFLYGVNYATGDRKTEIRKWLVNIPEIESPGGFAQMANNKQFNQTLTHTLSWTPQITNTISLNAVVGYEYLRNDFTGNGMTARGFVDYPGLHYWDYMDNVVAANRGIYSFADPVSELQSYFGRAVVNIADRFVITGTFRADGSSKFGENNRYGYFPSLAGAWNIVNESFMKDNQIFSNLRLRASWGKTGNQEFPSAASKEVVAIGQGSNQIRTTYANPDVKWETNTMTNVGLDFGIFENRLFGSLDWFTRTTQDALFQLTVTAPGPTDSRYWKNLPGEIVNSGFEFSLNGAIIRNQNMVWNLGFNMAFLQNEIKDLQGFYETGSLSGQGISGATSQRMVSGQPLNVYYLRTFEGIDKTTGQSIYTDDGNTLYYHGSPNPKTLLGITTDFTWKRLFAVMNFNGAFGHYLYNNTFNSVIPIGNLGTRNIAASLLDGDVQENRSNPIAPSTRYMEKGNYLKLANASVGWRFGDIKGIFRNASITLTGQNLLLFTKYKGFDPEVNTDKSVNGIPSQGIEYIPYPPSRTVLLGLNFTL